jgi:outer membrane protein assembly factor BamB
MIALLKTCVRTRFSHCLVALLALGANPAAADNWPGWRGPAGNGHSAEKDLPLKWSGKENVRWKVDLPGPGNSSPIVWGERVFLTQSLDKEGKRRAVMCFQRSDGKLLWQKETAYDDVEPTHATNPYCSATPVTDGKRVVASLGAAGMICYDFEGKELWRYELGKFAHIWGNASSPILYGDLVILLCGPGERQFLLAVNKTDGKKAWQVDVPGGSNKEYIGSWSTPIIARVGDHDELIACLPEKLKGFDPKTGVELWSCDGPGKLAYASPVCSADGIVVAFSGYGGPALAVRAGGKGDVTETHRLWHHPKGNTQCIGSPVIVGDHAYLIRESGAAQCYELKTGKEVWNKERLGKTCWSSLVEADGRLYIANDDGEIHVLVTNPKFELLGHNILEDTGKIQASIVVSDGELFIRSHKHLWCISQKNP